MALPMRTRAAARQVGEFLSSMTGRIFIILAAGMIAAAMIAAFTTNLANDRKMLRERLERVADTLQFNVELLDSVSPPTRAALLTAQQLSVREQAPDVRGLGEDEALKEALVRRGGLVATARVEFADLELCLPRTTAPATDEDRLWQGAEVRRAIERFAKPAAPADTLSEVDILSQECRLISVTLNDGTELRFASESPLLTREGNRMFHPAFMGLLLSAIGILAYVVARIASAPLKSLSASAVELGMDLDREPVEVSGPTEVKRAAEAFNAMQQRLQQHVGERTRMLAAITHDLQTPLTRLRLRLERVEDESLRERLINDMEAMKDLIAEGLELARSADTSEPPVMLDLDSLCQSVVEDAADAGGNAVFEGGCGVVMPLQPLALRRLLSNLIDNALKYGGSAVVSMAQEQGAVCLRVRDRGPGLPPDMLSRVFDPFFRLEASRSRQSGGTGLGLTIARTLAAKNGGTLVLRNHPDGGLEATVSWQAHPDANALA